MRQKVAENAVNTTEALHDEVEMKIPCVYIKHKNVNIYMSTATFNQRYIFALLTVIMAAFLLQTKAD